MSYEIRQTQYNDPEQKSGQHTNGPANIFVREDDASPWYFVEGQKSAYKVRKLIEELGFLVFTRRHCARVCD
ncbi:hypothetical protein SH139x_004232 [Planctomycetaceae bacterium SH139]